MNRTDVSSIQQFVFVARLIIKMFIYKKTFFILPYFIFRL